MWSKRSKMLQDWCRITPTSILYDLKAIPASFCTARCTIPIKPQVGSSVYILYIVARIIALWGRYTRPEFFFFFLESILKKISHTSILPKIDVDPRNHPKFHMRLSILHRKKIRIDFLRFFVSPAKGVPLPGEVAALLRHGSPSNSGTRFGRKIMILGAGPKMLHGWRRIISTTI